MNHVKVFAFGSQNYYYQYATTRDVASHNASHNEAGENILAEPN